MNDAKIIKEKQDLTYLKWSHIRNSSGTAGTFLKSSSNLKGEKLYYKLSNYDPERGIIGHECVNEIIVDRLLTLLGVDHLSYGLIHADIELEGHIHETYLCVSKDFKQKGESKSALDDYYRINRLPDESRYDFCIRQGWKDHIDRMIAVDFLILNRDRHGANIEVLRNPYSKSIRIAPLFDHGLSLLFSCNSVKAAEAFDIMSDLPCQNFIGSRSCFENLSLIRGKGNLFARRLSEKDKDFCLNDLDGILPNAFLDKIWSMIYERYLVYESFRNLRRRK